MRTRFVVTSLLAIALAACSGARSMIGGGKQAPRHSPGARNKCEGRSTRWNAQAEMMPAVPTVGSRERDLVEDLAPRRGRVRVVLLKS